MQNPFRIKRKIKWKMGNKPWFMNRKTVTNKPQITQETPKVKHLKPLKLGNSIVKYGNEAVRRIPQEEERKSAFRRFFGLEEAKIWQEE